MKKIRVKKGDILLRSGEKNTKIFHVESGLLRSFSIDEKGKEHIYMFAPENWIIADNSLENKPSSLFIDALEDSTLLVEDINKQIADPEKLLRRVAVLQSRIIRLMSASAIERYEHFIETYPQIVQRVPQKMIASYLGITPEALSRAKKEKARTEGLK